MDQENAVKIVNELLFGLQRVRSMTVEELTICGFEEKTVKAVISDLIPWMYGDKGDAFLKALAGVADKGVVRGMELYNFMTILHRLDKALLMMVSVVCERAFPEPEISWISELGV